MCDIKEEMSLARECQSVKQLEINQVISSQKYKYVFFVEGKDDIPCYRSWFGKIDQNFLKEMELINLSNKDNVLKTFLSYAERGRYRSGVFDKVYAIIDHDFDGYKDYESHDKIYLNSDVYSIENIICSEDVLEEILKSKFLCNDSNHIQKIKEKYRDNLANFLNKTKEVNKQIFFAKQLKKNIEIKEISLKFEGSEGSLFIENEGDILVLKESFDISELDQARLLSDFMKLNPEKQYRGKFLFQFFKKWVIFLGDNSGIPSVRICNFSPGDKYNGMELSKADKTFIRDRKVTNNVNQWGLSDYCSHSFPSESLKDFVKKITS